MRIWEYDRGYSVRKTQDRFASDRQADTPSFEPFIAAMDSTLNRIRPETELKQAITDSYFSAR